MASLRQWTVQMARIGRPGLGPDQAGGGLGRPGGSATWPAQRGPPGAAGAAGHCGHALVLHDDCLRGIGGCLLDKLVRSGVLRADEPILEAWMEMAGKLAPGPQSCRGDNAGPGVLYHVARIDGLPSGLPHAGLGGRSAASLRCLAGRGAIDHAGVTKAG
jgi:hypothetical protein